VCRTSGFAGLDVRNQLISATGVDPLFQIGNIVGNLVRSNNFDGITADKQIQRQLSRA
jgi:hypothetical protein